MDSLIFLRSFLLCLSLAGESLSADSLSEKLVIADFDDVIPLNLFGWDAQAVRIGNPVSNAANPSGQVAVWRKTGQWQGMGFFTAEKIDFARFPVYTFKIWMPVEGKVMIKFFNEQEGYKTKIEFTIPETLKSHEWQTVTFDASRLRSGYYDKVEVMPVADSTAPAGPFYFDDFILYEKR